MRSLVTRVIKRLFFEGQERSIKTKRNIAGLFILRGATSIINFVLVPLILGYLHQTRYGIWIALSSIIGWVGMMDVGLGNGLRNGVAKSLAVNDRLLARKLVSTTFALVGLIAVGIAVVFMCVNPFLPWSSILGGTQEMNKELTWLAGSVFVFFCLRLVFGLMGTVLIADQRPALATLIEVVVSVCSLLAVWILSRTTESSLFWLGFVISSIAAVVPIGATLLFFHGSYKDLAPARRYIDFHFGRELITLGIQFFFLQISGVLVFSSSNLVIIQLFGADAVVPFNIALKYFGIPLTGFTILLLPFWSAFTDAYTRGDKPWVLMTIRKLKSSWGILLAIVLIMLFLSSSVYRLWVGIDVPFLLSLATGAYVVLVAWSNIFAYFMNGIGKIRLQLWVAATTAVVVIPVAILLAKSLNLGSAGVMLAISLCLLPGCFLWPAQLRRLVDGRATGIWAR